MTFEGLPSDYYLWLTGMDGKLLTGAVDMSPQVPVRPQKNRLKIVTLAASQIGYVHPPMTRNTAQVIRDAAGGESVHYPEATYSLFFTATRVAAHAAASSW